MGRTRTISAVAGALVTVVAVAACGSSNSTPSPEAQSSGSTSSSDSPSTSARSTEPPTTKTAEPPHATEFNPPGDIPDDQVFVPYTLPGSKVVISVPEGWARSSANGAVTFTDKLNSVTIQQLAMASAPTVSSARSQEVPKLRQTVSQFKLGDATAISRQGGQAVLVTYERDSQPDAVTGKVIRDAVERYEFWRGGQEAVLTLSGPVGADNVDPWRLVSDSLHWG